MTESRGHARRVEWACELFFEDMPVMELNKIMQGDALEKLKELPDECVDCIITSPPYFGLRDYGVEGQIGLEKTLGEYLDKMLKVTGELKRVLKKTGTMFWNHGDSYGTGSGSGSRSGTKQTEGSVYWEENGKAKIQGYEKCLLLQAHRLAICMVDDDGDDIYELRKDAPDWVLQELTKKGLL